MTRIMSENVAHAYRTGLERGRDEGTAKLDQMIDYFEQKRLLALRDMEKATVQDAFAFATEARCYEHARDMVVAWKASDAPTKRKN